MFSQSNPLLCSLIDRNTDQCVVTCETFEGDSELCTVDFLPDTHSSDSHILDQSVTGEVSCPSSLAHCNESAVSGQRSCSGTYDVMGASEPTYMGHCNESAVTGQRPCDCIPNEIYNLTTIDSSCGKQIPSNVTGIPECITDQRSYNTDNSIDVSVRNVTEILEYTTDNSHNDTLYEDKCMDVKFPSDSLPSKELGDRVSIYRVQPVITQMCSTDIRIQPRHFIGNQSSQMNMSAWEYYLQFEQDVSVKDYLSTGVRDGFSIVDDISIIPGYVNDNYKSVLVGDAYTCIDKLIAEEYAEGKFILCDSTPLCVHSLGAVPKSDGTFRPITDCRQPLGCSMNNYMDTTHVPFNYNTVDSAASCVVPNCFMATVDISAAYRSVTVNPEHWTCQGISWELDGEIQFLLDTRLCFGIRCAPYIFTSISDFVARTMHKLGFLNVQNYIDDFLVFGETYDECKHAQNVLIRLLGELGFNVSWKKCTTPSRHVRYLGIDFDSENMTLCLPEDKLCKLHHELDYFSGKDRATKKQLQRLCGIIAHATKVVRGGRIFSRRLIDMLHGLGEGNPRVRLNRDFHLDIQWWLEFARTFNGKEHIIQQNYGHGPILFTDSCLKGYGLTYNADWAGGFFNTDILPVDIDLCDPSHNHWENIGVPDAGNINYLELVPIFIALVRYQDLWRNQHVLCKTDNTQVVSAVNKGVSVNASSMDLLRDMFWICAYNNIYLSAKHIPGISNVIPDALSRVADSNTLSNVLIYPICCSGRSSTG